MLLLIDAGNTRVKWALLASPATAGDAPAVSDAAPLAGAVPGRTDAAGGDTGRTVSAGELGQWRASGVVPHDGIGGLGAAWRAASATIDAILVSNVAGQAVAAALRTQFAALAGPHAETMVQWFASSERVAGVRNGYRAPHRLGCDRLAALAGARALWPDQALVVATCGTATTVDALDADGGFIGGMILPGLGTMAASLALRTAQLPGLDDPADAAPPPLFADHTEAAIRSGCLAAQAGAIERAVAAHGDARCVLSGGAARWIAPALRIDAVQVDNLVLIGLQAIALERAEANAGAAPTVQTTIAGRQAPA